jgi:hypothetical protein
MATTRAIFGGNRSGKTHAGGMEFLMHMTRLYPEWYPKEARFDAKTRLKGRIVVKDFMKGAGEVVIPFLEEWLDPALVEKKLRNPIGIPIKWILKTGDQWDILTHEQDVESFEGWHGHVAWFDEPPPRNKYIATCRGLVDYNGRRWLTLTPLTQPWIYDDIFVNQDEETFSIVVDITDNPHLPPEAIKKFEESLTEEEKEARLRGKFLHLSGLIYKEFSLDNNVCEPFEIPQDWTKYFCIDPHPRSPSACLWMAVDPKGNHYVYDELWIEGLDLEQLAYAIKAQEGDRAPKIRLIDPHMDNDNNLAGGFNVRRELMKYGIFCQRASSDPELGKYRIRQALTAKYDTLSKSYRSQLKVFRTCRQVIYEFQHYIWDDYRRNKDEYSPKETPKKKDDHFMDCLRYIYNNAPRYFEDEEAREATVVSYEGTYAKRPVVVERSSNYYDNVDRRM